MAKDGSKKKPKQTAARTEREARLAARDAAAKEENKKLGPKKARA